MSVRIPPPLHPGARIGVFAPSGRFDRDRLARGMAIVESWGFEIVEAPHLHAAHRYLAGDDRQRLADLKWALTEPTLQGAWMARGGYGLARLIDEVAWETLEPRAVIGFSDGTALHTALSQRAGIAGIHGPVLHSLGDGTNEAGREHLRRLLRGERSAVLKGRPLVVGRAEGPLVGGNLCMLTSLCGTADQLSARDAILVLEDIAEPAYKLDRMLNQLIRAGVMDGVRGVALGQFVSTRLPEGVDWTVEDVLLEQLRPLGVPILADLPIGHGMRNKAFFHGAPARIEGSGLVWSL